MQFLGRNLDPGCSSYRLSPNVAELMRTFWGVWGPPEQRSFVIYFPEETKRRALGKPQVQPDSRQWASNAECHVQVSCPDSGPTEAHAHSGNTEELLELAFELKNREVVWEKATDGRRLITGTNRKQCVWNLLTTSQDGVQTPARELGEHRTRSRPERRGQQGQRLPDSQAFPLSEHCVASGVSGHLQGAGRWRMSNE